jgi:hypothetical protein
VGQQVKQTAWRLKNRGNGFPKRGGLQRTGATPREFGATVHEIGGGLNTGAATDRAGAAVVTSGAGNGESGAAGHENGALGFGFGAAVVTIGAQTEVAAQVRQAFPDDALKTRFHSAKENPLGVKPRAPPPTRNADRGRRNGAAPNFAERLDCGAFTAALLACSSGRESAQTSRLMFPQMNSAPTHVGGYLAVTTT